MTIQDFLNKVIIGDAKKTLKLVPDNSIDMCGTSPPYYKLRDYGTAKWIGGDLACDHKGKPFRTTENINRNTGSGGADVKNKTK